MNRQQREANNMLRWMQSRLDNVIASSSNGREMQANCPFCYSKRGKFDVKQHLYVSKIKAAAHCFGCEWSGSWIALIIAVDGCSTTAAIMQIASGVSVEDYDNVLRDLMADPTPEESELDVEDIVPEGYKQLDLSKGVLNITAVNYLRNRGLSDWMIFSGMFGIVPGKMSIYIWASPKYWQARSVVPDAQPKYRNPFGVKLGDVLGLWDSTHLGGYVRSLDGPVHIAEGMFSALALLGRGKAALATLGKLPNGAQVKRLVALRGSLRVCFDSDAHENAWNLVKRLREQGKQDVDVAILEHGDPETCDEYEVFGSDWKSHIIQVVGG